MGLLRPLLLTHGTPTWGPSRFIKQFQRKRSQKFARGVLAEVSQKFVAARGSVQRAHACRALSTIRDETVPARSEEHTSELQSLTNLVCRLLLEKKKKK